MAIALLSRLAARGRMVARSRWIPRACLAATAAALLAGCESMQSDAPARKAMNDAILAEQPGHYFVGRRMYKVDYKMWGWIREPGQPWKTAKLVMVNEQKKLIPDRAINSLGADNNYEYRLEGYFSGEQVYEPASDSFYPEFVLTGYKVLNPSPARIFETKRQEDPEIRILQPPI